MNLTENPFIHSSISADIKIQSKNIFHFPSMLFTRKEQKKILKNLLFFSNNEKFSFLTTFLPSNVFVGL